MLIIMLTLLDGSCVNLSVDKTLVLDFQTRYGIMKIPAKDIGRMSLGVHVVNEKEYAGAVATLNDEKYGNRDTAMKFLGSNKRGAYRFLVEVKETDGLEGWKRAKQLLAAYNGVFPKITDDVFLPEPAMSLTGFLVTKSLSGESSSLGKLTIGVDQIVEISVRAQVKSFTIKPDMKWHKAVYVLNGKLSIKASGEVDMWPQQPGQWMAGPNGHNQQYNGYPSGSLVGRINNRVFLVGDSLSVSNVESGTLELSINGSPWNAQPTGEFTVEVE